MTEFYMGVDPGTKGGITILKGTGEVVTNLRFSKVTDKDITQFFQDYGLIDFCVLEKVHSFPGQGVSSTFKFGESYGKIQGFLAAFSIPYEHTTPRSWQKALSITKKSKSESATQWKNKLKGIAERLFPSEKIVLENADSYLIAEYCRRKHCVNFGVK